MFEEIVRQYAIEQTKKAFMLFPAGILLFGAKKQEDLKGYPQELCKYLVNKEYSKIDCNYNSYCFISTTKAAILYLKKQYADVISFCKKTEMDKALSDFFISIVEYEKENSASAFAKLVELSSYKSALPEILKKPLSEIVEKQNDSRNKNFFNQEYRNRKMFIPIEKISDTSGGKVQELLFQNISGITLPVGHPIPYEVYVGHPLDKQIYYPVSTYQLELLKDKIHEFCYLVQCLGATELTIESYNATSSARTTSENTDASAKVGSFASGSYHNEKHSRLYDEISNSMSVHQKFEPTKIPFIPEGLLWFPHEVSWQRMASQRIAGGLTFHEERMETKKVQMIESRELTQVKALFLKAEFTYDSEEDSKFEQHENEILSVKVKY